MAGPGQGEASEVTATPRPGAQGKATNEKRVVRRYVVIARDLSRSSWAVASLTVALAALFALWPRSASPLVSNGLAELIRAKALKEGISNSSACGGGLARDSGAEALLMAGHFILYSQLEDGTFIESYKYRSPIAVGTNYGQIEQTQIEAIRALTSLYRYARTAASQFPRGFQTRLHEAVTLSFSLVEQHSRATGSGARYIVLPNAKFGRVATVANVLLAMVDLQRALSSGPMPKGVGLNAPTFAQTAQGWRLQRSIRAYTAFLLNMRLRNGRFVRTYETNGKPRKQHTAKMHVPKSEGAALLALAAVAKYADRPELWPLVKESAAALVRAYAPGDPLQSGGEKHAERDGLSFEAFATAKFLEGGAAQERPAPLHPHATSSPVPLANERESMITARHASSAGAIRRTEDWALAQAMLEIADVADGQRPFWAARADAPGEGVGSAEDAASGSAQWAARLLLEWSWVLARKGPQAVPKLSSLAARAALAGVARAASREDAQADLEGEWARALACKVGAGLGAGGAGQLGGPHADPESSKMQRVRYGYDLVRTPDFKFNRTKCRQHLVRSSTGSVQARRARIKAQAAKLEQARRDASTVKLNQGQQISVADILYNSGMGPPGATFGDPNAEPVDPECADWREAGSDQHKRCENDSPVGTGGFKACCRPLGGVLFACADDPASFPPHKRSLYSPPYTEFCVPQGYPALPRGYADNEHRPRAGEYGDHRFRAERDGCDMRGLGGVRPPAPAAPGGPAPSSEDENAGAPQDKAPARDRKPWEPAPESEWASTRGDGTRGSRRVGSKDERGRAAEDETEGSPDAVTLDETAAYVHAWVSALRLVF